MWFQGGRVIYLDKIIFSLQNSGGISVYFDNIIRGLQSHSVESCFCGNDSRVLERYRRCKVSSHLGVFHSSYYRLPTRNMMRIVTTVHDFTYEMYAHGPARWIHSWQKNKAIRHSDIVICVSTNTAHDLMRYCPIQPNRIRVIHNGVSETYFPLFESQIATNRVLFVGARSGYKNFNMAVGAVAAMPELELHIVGGGPLNKHEYRQLNALMPGRYSWLGRLSDEELNIAYNSAYALLYPSSYEGFGIPILEAMRAGCPVVAVNVSSIPEVAGEAALLVEYPSIELFSEALRQIPAQRNELREAGFRQAAKFSWDRCFAETLAVYKELL